MPLTTIGNLTPTTTNATSGFIANYPCNSVFGYACRNDRDTAGPKGINLLVEREPSQDATF
jgi:hypothetical protein